MFFFLKKEKIPPVQSPKSSSKTRVIKDTHTCTHTHLLQAVDLLFLPVLQGLALGQQRLPLLFHPHHFVLQPAAFVVQVPDRGLLGHLSGLQAADLTYEPWAERRERNATSPLMSAASVEIPGGNLTDSSQFLIREVAFILSSITTIPFSALILSAVLICSRAAAEKSGYRNVNNWTTSVAFFWLINVKMKTSGDVWGSKTV